MNGGKPVKPIPGNIWQLASAGVELAAAVAGGCALGYAFDRHFETGHWGLIVGALVGIVGGLYNMVRKAVHESLRMTRKSAPPKGPRIEKTEDRQEPPEAGAR